MRRSPDETSAIDRYSSNLIAHSGGTRPWPNTWAGGSLLRSNTCRCAQGSKPPPCHGSIWAFGRWLSRKSTSEAIATCSNKLSLYAHEPIIESRRLMERLHAELRPEEEVSPPEASCDDLDTMEKILAPKMVYAVERLAKEPAPAIATMRWRRRRRHRPCRCRGCCRPCCAPAQRT